MRTDERERIEEALDGEVEGVKMIARDLDRHRGEVLLERVRCAVVQALTSFCGSHGIELL